jgi:hypothetical protein
MKKRIISLILVVATLVLTLAGCAYNYAKDDMTKYATFDESAFFTALKNLVIADGDFGTDEAKRQEKVVDAIAQAILKVTDADKKFEGKVQNHDSIYFCYMAMDEDGNIFFADKMDETKMTNFQVGLSSLEGLNKAINDKLLTVENIKDYIYSTSAANKVSDGDVVSVSYFVSWTEEGAEKTDVVWNEYHEVNASTNDFSKNLVGATVGVELPNQFSVTKDGVTKNYSNVKVESIAKDNSTPKVADGDIIFLTYTISFDATPWLVVGEDGKKTYNLPEELTKNVKYEIDGDGRYKATVTKTTANVTAYGDDAYTTEGEGDAAKKVLIEDKKNFLSELVGKDVGATLPTITIPKQVIGDKTVEVKYTSAKVNWIVKGNPNPIQVEYTPYEEALNEEKTNKKEETNIWGEKITLNGKKLTYAIFPVYYIDVLDYTTAEKADLAEFILNNFYSVVNSTETAEHDHTEEEHEHETVYVFESLNKDDAGNEFKNGDKTLATLVGELAELYTTYTEKEKALNSALTSLNTAQKNLASTTYSPSDAEYKALQTKLENAETAYISAKTAEQTEQAKINTKIDDILKAKKGEAAVADALVADYKTYQYDTLEDAYKAKIKTNLATEIIEYLQKNITYKSNLPKKAVKNAYDAIMNVHKYNFYEGNYSSGSSTTSTSSETNYKHYNGDFNAYLIDKVTSNKGNMDDVKASIQKEAEDTVKDIIMIYVFADAVEAKWSDADVILTKAEKKQIKKDLENTALLYQQYYGITYNYNVDDSYHAEQFDKVMNYLLELADEKENDNFVYYKNITYKFESTETE